MNVSNNFTFDNSTPTVAVPGIQPCIDTTFFTKPSMVAKVLFMAIILAVSLIGNVLIIFVVYKNQVLRRTINFFIVNMALSDLLFPMLILPREISNIVRMDTSWLLEGATGEFTCKFVFFLSDVSPLVSVLSLIFMTFDRFLAVVFPLRITLMNSKRRYILIALTWIISFVFFSPYFYAFNLIQLRKGGKKHCVLSWSRDPATHISTLKAYSTAMSILFLVIPLILLTVMYTVILIKARSTPELIRVKNGDKARQKQKKTAKRVTIMAFTIVLIFGLCWGPYNILLFLLIFVWDWTRPALCHWPSILFAIQFLCYSNAAINPLVYFIFIKNFRRGLMKQLSSKRSRIKKQIRAQNHHSQTLLTSMGPPIKNDRTNLISEASM